MKVTLKRQKRSQGDGTYDIEIKGVSWTKLQSFLRAFSSNIATEELATLLDEASGEAL